MTLEAADPDEAEELVARWCPPYRFAGPAARLSWLLRR